MQACLHAHTALRLILSNTARNMLQLTRHPSRTVRATFGSTHGPQAVHCLPRTTYTRPAGVQQALSPHHLRRHHDTLRCASSVSEPVGVQCGQAAGQHWGGGELTSCQYTNCMHQFCGVCSMHATCCTPCHAFVLQNTTCCSC